MQNATNHFLSQYKKQRSLEGDKPQIASLLKEYRKHVGDQNLKKEVQWPNRDTINYSVGKNLMLPTWEKTREKFHKIKNFVPLEKHEMLDILPFKRKRGSRVTPRQANYFELTFPHNPKEQIIKVSKLFTNAKIMETENRLTEDKAPFQSHRSPVAPRYQNLEKMVNLKFHQRAHSTIATYNNIQIRENQSSARDMGSNSNEESQEASLMSNKYNLNINLRVLNPDSVLQTYQQDDPQMAFESKSKVMSPKEEKESIP